MIGPLVDQAAGFRIVWWILESSVRIASRQKSKYIFSEYGFSCPFDTFLNRIRKNVARYSHRVPLKDSGDTFADAERRLPVRRPPTLGYITVQTV